MSSAVRIPPRLGGGAKPKSKRPNPVRRIMDREQRIRENSVASSSSTTTPTAAPAPPGRICKNPQCDKSDIRDGACQNCGLVADDGHDIVAEVTFGETSNGAAVVHGSYLAADQGGIRPTGRGFAFRRVAGAGASEARERSLREAKQLLSQFSYQLSIPQYMVDQAFQLYKVAANSNFVQGRRKNTVAAICMYAACRKEDSNKVMLIDLADIIKTDVFLLGRSYKELLSQLPDLKDGTKPIIIEDLIFRFASKLEFLHDTNKVALSAIRIAQRMRHDNITHGRRPAGICGAALIMAARAHNYRRTVREVVYIAKVTMATLQERMEEFANVPSAQMTIREFHESDKLPETSHDPPFVYKQTKEWQEKHKKKGKKRKAAAVTSESGQSGGTAEQQDVAKRQKTVSNEAQTAADPSTPATDTAATSTASPSPAPQTEGSPTAIVDKDGFVVPPLPQQSPRPPPSVHDRSLVQVAMAPINDQLEALADEFGESEEGSEEEDEGEEFDPSSEMAMAAAQGIQVPGMKMKIKPRARPPGTENTSQVAANGGSAGSRAGGKPTLRIDEEWELDETNLENEMQGHLDDPAMIGASAAVTKDIEDSRERESAARAERPGSIAPEAGGNNSAVTSVTGPQLQPDPSDTRFTPTSKVSDDPIIHEDEFKDDPEVMFCKLSERDVRIKEMIWANHNKDYMRKVQQKIFEAKMAEKNPPKPKRNRTKRPRIGEGQASPAGSATEATQNMLRTRAISTKLDYSRMGNLFDISKRGPGSTYGGASSVASRSAVPSDAGSDNDDDDFPDDSNQCSAGTTGTAAAATSLAQHATVEKTAIAPDNDGEADGGEDDDDNEECDDGQDGYQEETYGEQDFNPFGDDGDYDEE
ncbi:transcription factor TFIIIB subunit brf1 [Madurella fahalii]|uniref:Transcription factor TFIIIB subunit brf1 n=1 Tax=Madurella fahalii TaxID=1157608 RepID=A0ABQ0GNQ9_9PEZI